MCLETLEFVKYLASISSAAELTKVLDRTIDCVFKFKSGNLKPSNCIPSTVLTYTSTMKTGRTTAKKIPSGAIRKVSSCQQSLLR